MSLKIKAGQLLVLLVYECLRKTKERRGGAHEFLLLILFDSTTTSHVDHDQLIFLYEYVRTFNTFHRSVYYIIPS